MRLKFLNPKELRGDKSQHESHLSITPADAAASMKPELDLAIDLINSRQGVSKSRLKMSLDKSMAGTAGAFGSAVCSTPTFTEHCRSHSKPTE